MNMRVRSQVPTRTIPSSGSTNPDNSAKMARKSLLKLSGRECQWMTNGRVKSRTNAEDMKWDHSRDGQR